MTKPMLKNLANLAIKTNKKPEPLKGRIEHAKKTKTKVYFMIDWITVEQAEYILKQLECPNA